VFPFLSCCVLAAASGAAPSGEEILARVADNSTQRRSVGYSGLRRYNLRNIRFLKEATVSVGLTYRPGEGKHFTILERSGSVKLTAIVERLLTSEAEASRPTKLADHQISPANYTTRLRGTETTAGRLCYVIELTPKYKSKYLIKGTIWIDYSSYGIVRLDGSTAASISMWVGTPQITEEFSEVAGLWLPTYTRSVSSGFLLGTSELEIHHTDYRVIEPRSYGPAGDRVRGAAEWPGFQGRFPGSCAVLRRRRSG
jgi:hypothetical protein